MILDNIPDNIKTSQQFCLWKYSINSKISRQIIKKPYGFCKKTKALKPSLKNQEYWMDWNEILEIFPDLNKNWGIGLILTDGPYVAIDLDQCLKQNENNTLKIASGAETILELFQDTYIEVSPSLKGFHIIFEGEWPYEQNKGIRCLDQISNFGTIEIYSGKDCRFITLTGLKFNSKNKKNKDQLNFYNEMKFLYLQYFKRSCFDNSKILNTKNITANSNRSLHISDNKKTLRQIQTIKEPTDTFISIKKLIQNSKYFQEYKAFYTYDPIKYKSISEADWHFCLFTLKFFTLKQAENSKLLEKFLLLERPKREKLERLDYIQRTAYNAILKAKEDNSIGSLLRVNKNSLKAIAKNKILKLCNTMNIFQLGRQNNNQVQQKIINKDPNNYLEATILQSLNSKDLDYYIQILEQAAQKIKKENLKLENIKDKHLGVEINIHEVLRNLGLNISGQAYKDFIDSLDKIMKVTIKQEKKINHSNKLSKYGGNILSYSYEKNKKYKKLIVYLNLLTTEILMQAEYNYSLFNLESYRHFKDHRLRFLYYYFCLKTIPGGYPVQYTVDQLTSSIWVQSSNKETIKKRRKTLIDLLKTLEIHNNMINDLKFHLIREPSNITGISVKKQKMLII